MMRSSLSVLGIYRRCLSEIAAQMGELDVRKLMGSASRKRHYVIERRTKRMWVEMAPHHPAADSAAVLIAPAYLSEGDRPVPDNLGATEVV